MDQKWAKIRQKRFNQKFIEKWAGAPLLKYFCTVLGIKLTFSSLMAYGYHLLQILRIQTIQGHYSEATLRPHPHLHQYQQTPRSYSEAALPL